MDDVTGPKWQTGNVLKQKMMKNLHEHEVSTTGHFVYYSYLRWLCAVNFVYFIYAKCERRDCSIHAVLQTTQSPSPRLPSQTQTRLVVLHSFDGSLLWLAREKCENNYMLMAGNNIRN